MAEIIGLKEAGVALGQVRKIIKEIKDINQFLSTENPTTTYYLSFTVKKPISQEETETEAHEDVIPLQGPTLDSPELPVTAEGTSASTEEPTAPKTVKKKRTNNTTQYSTPLLCDNKDALYHFIYLYKERKVRTALQLAEMHRLRFSDEEKEILGIS